MGRYQLPNRITQVVQLLQNATYTPEVTRRFAVSPSTVSRAEMIPGAEGGHYMRTAGMGTEGQDQHWLFGRRSIGQAIKMTSSRLLVCSILNQIVRYRLQKTEQNVKI